VKQTHFVLQLVAGSLLVLAGAYGFLLLNGTWIPQDALTQLDRSLASGESEIRLDGIAIQEKIELEFILSRHISGKRVGDRVLLVMKGGDAELSRSIPLIPYFEVVPFPSIHLIVMGLSALIGFVVFVLKREDVRARLLYWSILTFAAAEVITGGFHCLDSTWTSFIPGILFYICYALAPTFLLHFSLNFTSDQPRKRTVWIYAGAIVFILVLEVLFLYSSMTRSIEDYRVYQSVFYFFRIYVLGCLLVSVANLFLLLKRAPLEEDKARIQWFLYSLSLGLGPFVLLYLLPKILTLPELISMETAMAFSPLALVGAAIAIIRHRLLDIELVINRSLVYSILTVFVVATYLFLVRLLQGVLSHTFQVSDTFVSALAAFGAALAFHPARKKIQGFVDRSFFREAYDFQKSVQAFAEQASQEIDPQRLADSLIRQLKEVMPLSHIWMLIHLVHQGERGVFLLRGEEEKMSEAAPAVEGRSQPLGRMKALRLREQIDFSQDAMLTAQGWDLVFPIVFSHPGLSGFLVLGPKRSGERYGRIDVALLQTLTQELGANLERIRLQEEVVYERAEKEKLDELNSLKTEFISAVSHELRTPMSTLRNLADLLQDERIMDKEKRGKLLQLMSEECTRLSHFLFNILDSGRIERDAKSYAMENSDLVEMVEETMALFEYRLQKERFTCHLEVPPHPVILILDRDAVKQALMNLIDNAFKYSGENREIRVNLEETEPGVLLSVEDKGSGIPVREQQDIFEGFFRGETAVRENPSGVGIGLKIVKHIMDAHGGSVRVESEPGEGSKFILEFSRS
jgi:two-component system phosphate regulon sensor histidine kinase PhoR